ncbi:hypothetical protein D3C81_2190710 [compost metagenome]
MSTSVSPSHAQKEPVVDFLRDALSAGLMDYFLMVSCTVRIARSPHGAGFLSGVLILQLGRYCRAACE